jgi:TP901 family phage tail tape measure protein
MTTDIGELRARLSLEAQQFRRGMEQTRTQLLTTGGSSRELHNRFQALSSSLQGIGLSARHIDMINDRIRRANPQILQQMLRDVRTELEGVGVDSREIGRITAEIERAERGGLSLEEQLTKIQTAAAGLGAAVVAAIGVSVKTAADFEAQMSRVKAISGATDTEFQNLEASALTLGASTSKSASEVALGFEDMAAMGFNANEIIAAMPGVISAAEASGSELAETAGIVASALNAFQLKASDATKVADVLAMTANISAASISDMGYALKYVGPVANALGISLEEVSAAIGIMTNAGIDGSSAGTSLRAALLALNNPAKAQEKMMKELGFSMKDANGNAKGLADIIGGLTESTKNMTQAEKVATIAKLVGTEASSGMIAVIEGGTDKLNEFTDSLRNSGGASKEAAGVMKDNLKGAYDELSGALETVGIKLGKEFLPLLTDVTNKAASVVGSIAEMDMSTVNAGLAFAGVTSAIALIITTIGRLAIAVKGLMVSMGPYGWLIAGVSLLGGAIAATVIHQNELREVSLATAEAMLKQADDLDANINQFDALQAKSKLTNDEFARFIDINSILKETADPRIIAALTDEQNKLREKSGLSNDELNTMVDLNGKLIEKVPEATRKITDQGNAILENTDKVKAYNQQQYERIRLELDSQKAKAEANMKDYLRDEEETLKRINGIKVKLSDLDVEEIEQRKKVKGIYDDLAVAKANQDEVEIDRLTRTIEMEEHKVEAIKKQRAEQAEKLIDQTKDLDKIQEQIGKLDEVKRKMVELELRQVGINAKRGEEISAIDGAIGKLEKQKKELQDLTPVNQRNTAEYQQARDAIQEQINKLQGTKQKVEEIIGKAQELNAELGKDISKTIYQHVVASNNYNNSKANALKYHTGGIVGKDRLPTLHTGGMASQFMSAPMHNEIDIRALPNEMYLTEAQQANLFRMIDAGFTNAGNQQMNYSEIYRLLGEIKQAIQNGMNATLVLDGKKVGMMVEPHVTEAQFYNQDRRGRF